MKKKTDILLKICMECDNLFYVNANRKQERKRKFCCHHCAISYIGKSSLGKKRSNEFKRKMSEKYSGKGNPFYGKFHTKETKQKWSKIRKNVSWEEKLGKERADKLKLDKSKAMIGENNNFYGKHHTIETRAIMSEHASKKWDERFGKRTAIEMKLNRSEQYKGSNNPAWNDGSSFGEYGEKFNKELKTEIRKRDKFVCAICGKNGFSVHHIDYNKKNNEKENLITLCRSCHGKTGFNRKHWMAFFRSYKGEENEK